MSSQESVKMNVEEASRPAKKEWKKPVLDILELQNAQHGPGTISDGVIKHYSH